MQRGSSRLKASIFLRSSSKLLTEFSNFATPPSLLRTAAAASFRKSPTVLVAQSLKSKPISAAADPISSSTTSLPISRAVAIEKGEGHVHFIRTTNTQEGGGEDDEGDGSGSIEPGT
ncbi:hypothetical protein GW17_00038368 [Ensete ventricosum]|nr:hypothetical protein GW17_00038368 [Ensete ventricosum]RZS04665.1 hypothetical protein BHM03_00035026 [Ensete ventricosum]